MKKNFARTNDKLVIKRESIRRLSDLNLRVVVGGLTSGHITCDSAFCHSFGTQECG